MQNHKVSPKLKLLHSLCLTLLGITIFNRYTALDIPLAELLGKYPREYALHAFAGTYFGCMFPVGPKLIKNDMGKRLVKHAGWYILFAPGFFLATIHQSRGMLNDGVAITSLAVGYIIALLFIYDPSRKDLE